jgi:hypothetical protein
VFIPYLAGPDVLVITGLMLIIRRRRCGRRNDLFRDHLTLRPESQERTDWWCARARAEARAARSLRAVESTNGRRRKRRAAAHGASLTGGRNS